MKRVWRLLAAGTIIGLTIVGMSQPPARADNCSSLSDCYFTVKTVSVVTVAMVVVVAATWLASANALDTVLADRDAPAEPWKPGPECENARAAADDADTEAGVWRENARIRGDRWRRKIGETNDLRRRAEQAEREERIIGDSLNGPLEGLKLTERGRRRLDAVTAELTRKVTHHEISREDYDAQMAELGTLEGKRRVAGEAQREVTGEVAEFQQKVRTAEAEADELKRLADEAKQKAQDLADRARRLRAEAERICAEEAKRRPPDVLKPAEPEPPRGPSPKGPPDGPLGGDDDEPAQPEPEPPPREPRPVPKGGPPDYPLGVDDEDPSTWPPGYAPKWLDE